MKLVSDQVSPAEIHILIRELSRSMLAAPAAAVVEFGCYKGTSALFIAQWLEQHHSKAMFHVYDSFAGLPTKTSKDDSPAGLQFKEGELKASKADFVRNFQREHLPLPFIHKGWFSNLSPNGIPPDIAFAFLDGDYYESIRDSLRLVWPKLAASATIVVDDYQNESLPGAQKAVDEWLQTHPAKLRVEASMAIIYI